MTTVQVWSDHDGGEHARSDDGRYARDPGKPSRVVEECEFFLDYTSVGAREMAEILGMSYASLNRALTNKRRLNRPDLWRRLYGRDVRNGRVQITDEAWEAAMQQTPRSVT